MDRKTSKIELVETHNLAISLDRLYDGRGGFDEVKWRRALYHALAMSGNANHSMLKSIREALELP